MAQLHTRLLQKMTSAAKLSLFTVVVFSGIGMTAPSDEKAPSTKMSDTNGFHNTISFGIEKDAIACKFEITGKVSGMR